MTAALSTTSDADGKQVVCEIISSTPNFASNPWIFLANDSNAWTALNELSGNRGHLPDNPDGAGFRAWLYISPMIRGSQSWPANSSGIKREVVFRCHKHNNENQTTPDITITQYEPISAEINGQRVYIDRVDREEMPWGFENVQINNNQSSGFENGYWLMVNRWNTQPNPANGYRPFGGGSVMMTAAFGHHFHVDGVPNFNTTNVNNGTFPANATRPANGSYAYAVPSRAEWKLLEQMDIFDPSFPVGSWDRYWTSDAVTELDSRESYIYQKGYGEQTAPRTEMLKSRMIFMRAPVPAVLAPAE